MYKVNKNGGKGLYITRRLVTVHDTTRVRVCME